MARNWWRQEQFLFTYLSALNNTEHSFLFVCGRFMNFWNINDWISECHHSCFPYVLIVINRKPYIYRTIYLPKDNIRAVTAESGHTCRCYSDHWDLAAKLSVKNYNKSNPIIKIKCSCCGTHISVYRWSCYVSTGRKHWSFPPVCVHLFEWKITGYAQ